MVYCQPGAKQTRVAGWHYGKIKIQLKAPPVDGEANKALIRFLAEFVGVPQSQIEIEIGQASRTKRVKIDGVDDAVLIQALSAGISTP